MKKAIAISELKRFLDQKVIQYNQPTFISEDPVSIPHLFSRQQDQEIAGFFAAVFSWGGRKTIINKSRELMRRMDDAPHDFCLHHTQVDLKRLERFGHRTFNDTDLLYFLSFLQYHYQNHDSLQDAFFPVKQKSETPQGVEDALNHFYQYFFSLEYVPERTRKHIAAPLKKSSCKRLNMFLRWMVRKDQMGVDFGIWDRISPSQLICPVDVHVARVARRFGLLKRKPVDWLAAGELTQALRVFDPADPVKYDYALFGLGITEKY